MELPSFELHRPASAEEAAELLARFGEQADLLAGGTDLLPNYKMRLNCKPHVISLGAVRGMRELTPRRIGALVRLVEIERDPGLAAALPLLRETARQISSPPLREHGTLGGNLMLDTRCHFFNQSPLWRRSKHFCLKAEGTNCLVVPASNDHCYATYSGEMAAALLVLGASAELLSAAGGRRSVPLGDFFADDGIARFADRRAGELLLGVTIPEDARTLRGGYRKLRIRESIDFPSLGVALGLRLAAGGEIEDLRVATTAVASRPELLEEAAAPFVGRRPSAALAAEVGQACMRASTPYRNVPLEPKYRKTMVAVFVRRLLAGIEPGFAA